MATTEGVRIRPATPADLPACHDTWRDGLNAYFAGQGRPAIPPDNPALRRLHGHLLATDPGRFRVAETAAGEVVGFGAAVGRGRLRFLSMLFVRPGLQARGLGRALLAEILPPEDGAPIVLATATDSGQPVSNGLYAELGMAPRLPIFNLVGRPERPGSLPVLPSGITPVRADGSAPSRMEPGLQAELDALDRAVLGFDRAVDHGFVRAEGRRLFSYRDGAGRLAGYGYASEVGRLGPVSVADPSLLGPVVAHLLEAIEPRGASAVWLAGDAGEAFAALVRAGLRIEDLPVLLCWSEPLVDFRRAVPISPGLL